MMLWLNGALVAAEAARIDPADRGFLLGDGLFETMRSHDGEVAELARHYARLTAGAALLRTTVPISQTALALAIRSVLSANLLPDAALRLTLTRGPAERGLLPSPMTTPTLLLTCSPLPQFHGPLRLITSSIRRDETSPLSTIKTLNYLPGILARIEAAERGADDAVLLNHAGRVAETSIATLFVRLSGEWLTPPVSEGALPGICRAGLLASGRVREWPITIDDLKAAEALSTGNALALRSVFSIDNFVLRDLATP